MPENKNDPGHISHWLDTPEKQAQRTMDKALKWKSEVESGKTSHGNRDHFSILHQSREHKDFITKTLKIQKLAESLVYNFGKEDAMLAIKDQTPQDQIEILCNSDLLSGLVYSDSTNEDLSNDIFELLEKYEPAQQNKIICSGITASHLAGKRLLDLVNGKKWTLSDQKTFLCNYPSAGSLAEKKLGHEVIEMLQKQETDEDKKDILSSRYFVYDMTRYGYGEEVIAQISELPSIYQARVLRTTNAAKQLAETCPESFWNLIDNLDSLNQSIVLTDEDVSADLNSLGSNVSRKIANIASTWLVPSLDADF